MRLLVCGGRNYADREAVRFYLDKAEDMARRATALECPIDVVIHGGATGADQLASEWARTCGIPEQVYPADWATHGKAAGPIRNQRMLEHGKPTAVVVFPGGSGTEDMARRATAAGLPVWRPLG